MTHPDSPEFLAILERVPRWHMLTPGVDVWREGDEVGNYINHEIGTEWEAIENSAFYGDKIVGLSRRPVPEHVRRSEAWWALYNQLATVTPNEYRFSLDLWYGRAIAPNVHGRNTLDAANFGYGCFETREAALAAIPILGGEAEIIKNLEEGPGAYMRWILEKNRP